MPATVFNPFAALIVHSQVPVNPLTFTLMENEEALLIHGCRRSATRQEWRRYNKSGKLRAGQTVHSPLIPRLPVAEVPTSAIANAEQGGRKVQVIREGFVRDIPVQLLGPVGADHVFVSGRFGVTDELVSKTSEPLVDGVRVTARDIRATSKPANASQPAQPSSGGASF